MGQQVRRRPQGNVLYQANSKVSIPLSRGMIYRDLYLKFYGTVAITAITNLQANILHGDEWGVIKRIDLIANNTDVLRSISGNQLWWLNYFMYGVPPNITPRIGDEAADPPWESFLVLPLWMPRSLRPMDTALDARELSDLKLEITWGDFNDINANVACTGFDVDPVLEVHSLESFGAKGPFSQWRVYAIEKAIAATAAQFQVHLPVGPMYRGFLMNFTEGAGAAIADTGAILNNFKLISGTTVFADIPASLLNVCDRLKQSVSRFWDDALAGAAGLGAYDFLRRGSAFNSLEGWYFYDHVTDGYLSESIDTLGFSEFEMELDVTAGAASRVFILPLQIIPVRGK